MFIFYSLSAIFHVFPMHFYSFLMKTIFKIHFLDSVFNTCFNRSKFFNCKLDNFDQLKISQNPPSWGSAFSTPGSTDRDSRHKHPKSNSGSFFTLSSHFTLIPLSFFFKVLSFSAWEVILNTLFPFLSCISCKN